MGTKSIMMLKSREQDQLFGVGFEQCGASAVLRLTSQKDALGRVESADHIGTCQKCKQSLGQVVDPGLATGIRGFSR